MNKKLIPYIYILFSLVSSHGIFSQDLKLNLTGKDSLETAILNNIEFKTKHATSKSIQTEILSIQKRLQYLGYFTNYLADLTNIKTEYIATFSLGPKIDFVIIKINKSISEKYKNFYFTTQKEVELSPGEIESYIQSILREFDDKGRSFTEINLIKPLLNKNSISTTLEIKESQQRNIDRVVIKGYENFPRSFLSKYLKIDSKKPFSKDRLKEISSLTKSLSFVKEIKAPEVLFKQDSTLLYLFLKRVQTSSIDGIINFGSKEDGSGLLINGNLDLKLNNVLNTGERFELFWNRVKEGNSEFKIGAALPYIFNSDISFSFNFNIYRQDSTFLNTTLDTKADYQVSPNSKIYLTYNSQGSDYLLDDINANFDNYTSNFIGIGYSFSKPSLDPKIDTAYRFGIFPSLGKRETSNNSLNQLRAEFLSETNFSLSSRSYIHITNKTSILDSKSFLTNELYRIGGANSIRGFNEQSIFTSKYSYFNTEFRYLTSINSYLHTILDIGAYEITSQSGLESLIGVGVGYVFTVNTNRINLGYALGIRGNTGVDLENSQIILRWTSVF